jgi:hypothetical protein
MSSPRIRALVTSAGSGAAGNIVRALRSMRPAVRIVGINDDQFSLAQSLAHRNYLCPPPSDRNFIDSVQRILDRERINVVMPGDDNYVKAFSDARRRLRPQPLLPGCRAIDLCQDKFALCEYLGTRRISVPRTYVVRSLGGIERIFSRFPGDRILWCRARHGARALGAAPVMTAEQARAWIALWRDLRGMAVPEFTLSEYLPGRHFIVPSVWSKGKLLRIQPTEVLSYFAAGNNPSGIFSLACLAKTVVAENALQTALEAIRAIERNPTGAFSVELKETSDGTPAITEINAGRFPAGVAALVAEGKDNMVALLARAAIGDATPASEPFGIREELYLVRDIDAEPRIVSPADLRRRSRRPELLRR